MSTAATWKTKRLMLFKKLPSGDGSIVGSEIVEEGIWNHCFSRRQACQEVVSEPRPDLDQFVVGSNNQLANAASIAVCDKTAVLTTHCFCTPALVLGNHLLSINRTPFEHNKIMTLELTTCEEFFFKLPRGLDPSDSL